MGLQDDLKKQVMARWELAADEVSTALQQTLAVAFLGSASAGKDSAIRALFGLDFGQVDRGTQVVQRFFLLDLEDSPAFVYIPAPASSVLASTWVEM